MDIHRKPCLCITQNRTKPAEDKTLLNSPAPVKRKETDTKDGETRGTNQPLAL